MQQLQQVHRAHGGGTENTEEKQEERLWLLFSVCSVPFLRALCTAVVYTDKELIDATEPVRLYRITYL